MSLIIILKDITRERLVIKVTPLDLTARIMLTTNVTRFLSNMRERFPEQNVRPLLIQPTLNIVKKNSSLSVTRNTMKLITVNRLLVMTHMLLLIILMVITRELLSQDTIMKLITVNRLLVMTHMLLIIILMVITRE